METPPPASDAFTFFEVVRFESDDPEFAEIAGLTGYVGGKSVPAVDEIAVFFYDIEKVWCVPATLCTSLGRIDEAEKAHSEWAREQIAKKYRQDDAQE